jgi:hypothetical protein
VANDRVTIENGQPYDDRHNRIDLNDSNFSGLKDAMASKDDWQDGTYRFDKTSKTLVSDGGGGIR